MRNQKISNKRLAIGISIGIVCAALGAQGTAALRAAPTPVKPIHEAAREIRETRIEVKAVTPVHVQHAKFHPRLDHNINRYANRSQHMMPIQTLRMESKERTLDGE